MEGLFVIIAIFFGLAKLAAKQQNQGNRSRQYSQRSQNPVQRQKHIPNSLKKVVMDMENSWNENKKAMGEYTPLTIPGDDAEGTGTEDRRRSGSLEYVEQRQSSEGECYEHPEHMKKKRNEKVTAAKDEIVEREQDILLDMTEDNLLRGIVMAEVLGPPRAMKRRIR